MATSGRRYGVITAMVILTFLSLTGCGSEPNPGPSIGAGLGIVGLSLIVSRLVERVRTKGGGND